MLSEFLRTLGHDHFAVFIHIADLETVGAEERFGVSAPLRASPATASRFAAYGVFR